MSGKAQANLVIGHIATPGGTGYKLVNAAGPITSFPS